jgi:Carboxypeptidase regulatory-like domain
MTRSQVLLAVLGCTLLASFPVRAQVTGSITGTVRDNTQAVVPGAKVMITYPDKGIERSTTTNSDGDYLVAGLGAGTYNVSITAPGFAKFQAHHVVLRIGEKIRVDTTLVLGKVNTEVDVEGSAAGQVETQSSEMSGTIDGKQISQLELNGRNFTQLVTLIPGVSDQTFGNPSTGMITGSNSTPVGPSGSVAYAINGGRTEYNNWEIDGGDDLDNGSNENLNVFPNVDAIGEMKILTSTYGAQYGRNGSGTIEAVTKSGTNEFHGEAFEFLRNEMFNAHNYFDPPDTPKAAYKKHDFGYTIGGPIQKNKTFFFWSQEFRRENTPADYNHLVPSTAERQGIFNDVCPAGSAAGTAFIRPGTTAPTPLPGDNFSNQYPDCPAYQIDPRSQYLNSGSLVFDAFPNNNIASFIDHANSDPLVSLIPQGNQITGSGDFFRAGYGQPTHWHEELIKVDHSFSSKIRGFFRFIHDSYDQTQPQSPWSQSTLPAISGVLRGPGVSVVASLTASASPTLLNEFVFSYGTDHLQLTNTSDNWKRPSSMTMTGLFNNGFGGTLPGYNVSNGNAYGGGFAIDPGIEPWANSNPTYTYRDNVTRIVGAHNIQFGGYFVAAQKNEPAGAYTQGFLTFGGNGNTAYLMANQNVPPVPPNVRGPSTGNAFADLLIGDIGSFYQANVRVKYYFRYKIFEPYLQDDWHVSKKLTLNLGVRVSFFGNYSERYGHAYNFDPAFYNAANAPQIDLDDTHLIFPAGQSVNTLTGMVQCGSHGLPAGCIKDRLVNPAPRIGFAWDPKGNGKMAIRAAYGIFYEHMNGNEANVESLEGQPPLLLTPSQGSVQGYTNLGAGGGQVFPFGPTSIPQNIQWPYMQQWHLDIQRELARGTLVTVAYVGSKGSHLPLQYDANQLHPVPASQNPFGPGQPLLGSECDNGVGPNGAPIAGQAQVNMTIACGEEVGNTLVLNNGNVDPDLLRTNFPGFSTITRIATEASSSYNALQVSGRRTVGSLELTLAYTYSHSIDDSSDRYDSTFVNSYDIAATRASSNFDQRHILTISYIYDLPLFRHATGKTKTFLGGWQLSGITSVQTGVPVTVANGTVYDNAGVANGAGDGSYEDIVGNPHAAVPAAEKFSSDVVGPLLYNPAAYVAPQGLTFGDSGRDSLYLPRRTNFDVGLFKRFAVGESKAFEFRAEAFNVFNHPQWLNIDSTADCAVGPTQTPGDPTCIEGNAASGTFASDFLHPIWTHDPRILQFGLKFVF